MEGGRYNTEPVSLVYDDNNYYMLSYSQKYDHLVTYRVDRMDQVRVEEDDLSAAVLSKTDDTGTVVEEAFRMYLGDTKIVTIRFHDRLIGVMYDKFGEDLQIRRVDSQTCEAEIRVQISPPFWGWLLQYPKDIQLIAPEDVKIAFAAQLRASLDQFSA